MPADERAHRARGLVEIVTSRDPGDWIDEQLADIRAKGATAASVRYDGPPRQAPGEES